MPEFQLTRAVAGGQLGGSVVLPATPGPWPVVLVIAGSGPTDRNGSNPLLPGPCDCFRRLAYALAAHGIASLRYDKRGVGASAFPGLSEEQLSIDGLVDDAVALARWLRDDGRFDRVVLAGHSEGALIASLAAERFEADALVSIAAAGERASTLMRRQLEANLPADFARPALAALDALERGERLDDVPDDFILLFRPSVQPYLMSWFRHDPAEVLARLDLPVLLVHGANDAQVRPDNAQALWRARPDARLRIVAGMDHLLAAPDEGGVRAIADEVAALLRARIGTAPA